MSTGIQVRTATALDAAALATLDATSWPSEVQVAPPQGADEPFFTSWRQPEDVLVAEVDQVLVGYARLAPHMRVPGNEHVLHLDALVASADARGKGVGSALLEATVAEARRRGVAKLGLRTVSNNRAALRLYTRHGFVEEGRLRAELRRPDGTYADDVWMALWLAELPSTPPS